MASRGIAFALTLALRTHAASYCWFSRKALQRRPDHPITETIRKRLIWALSADDALRKSAPQG